MGVVSARRPQQFSESCRGKATVILVVELQRGSGFGGVCNKTDEVFLSGRRRECNTVLHVSESRLVLSL